MIIAKLKNCVPALKFLCLLLGLNLISCASVPTELLSKKPDDPVVASLKIDGLYNLPPSERLPVVAVYKGGFTDLTGQRKSNSEFALFSTAVSQGGEAYLIRALKHAADGKFFKVVERVGIDHITRERQIIRSTRKDFKEDSKLQPLLFAGLVMGGGIISYDSNIRTGGTGARYLGIGASQQYREDLVVVSLRTISVSTGEVLIEVLVTKKILSVGLSTDLFRFYEMGTELIELEIGATVNESMSVALQKAVEAAVLETITEGEEKGFWSFSEG